MNKVFARKLSSLVSSEFVSFCINQFLLSIVSYSFYLFGEFEEVLDLKGKSDAYK